MLAFAELAALGIGQRGAEILRLADDRGIAHPHELVAHLDGDVLQRALDDRGGDRVDARLGDGVAVACLLIVASPSVMMRLPAASATSGQPGGTTVVVSVCRTIAGPAIVCADRQQVAPVERRVERLRARRRRGTRTAPSRTCAASSDRRCRRLGVGDLRHAAAVPLTRTLTISIGLAAKAWPYSAAMGVVECARTPRRALPASIVAVAGTAISQLVALADIAQIAAAHEASRSLGRCCRR